MSPLDVPVALAGIAAVVVLCVAVPLRWHLQDRRDRRQHR